MKSSFSARPGTKSSLKIILMASARGCRSPPKARPKTAARFGPILSCMRALTLRSASVSSAVKPITAPRKTRTFTAAWAVKRRMSLLASKKSVI